MPIPILTYHSLHAPGHEYATNDHVALATDLNLLHELDFDVVSARTVAEALADPESHPEIWSRRVAAITFDDGCDHDFVDFSFPGYGSLESFHTILVRHAETTGRSVHGTSFVIASPTARAILDKVCIAGRDQWRDAWWRAADRSGFLEIANHSWDHTHPELDFVTVSSGKKGEFHCIDNWSDADMQIMQAELYVRHVTGRGNPGLFAYPYGHCPDFLAETYFPHHRNTFAGAFGTGGAYVLSETSRWHIPRFVCGEHWSSPEELGTILQWRGISLSIPIGVSLWCAP